ncbi:DNA-directed RNA polymerase III subunit RPC9 [Drosophila sechellia]|uniref:DNA-directed RNA polymerase III subunit RPC9 n=1 Tax=Drosophila sechellia TaxID=7238 RepID=B4IEU7_DROSE|nr:DNA-directed RNA polymerase III subunit RPC9 [Drosophila sechellia]EDW46201.1 GM13474 [Drosophila sechellia]
METVNPTFSYLTNLEVMQILQKIKSTKKKFGMRNLATVTYEALQYLEESPCKTQTRENIMNYVKDLSSYRLKSQEILQMINDPPTSALHTQLLIDDNKAPLTDEENEKIIQLSYKHFHGGETKGTTKETPAEKPAESTAKTGKQSGKRNAQAKSNPAEIAPADKTTPGDGVTNVATPSSEATTAVITTPVEEATPVETSPSENKATPATTVPATDEVISMETNSNPSPDGEKLG